MMKHLHQVLKYFPEELKDCILSKSYIAPPEEIRIRRGKHIHIYAIGTETQTPYIAGDQLMQGILDRVTQRSPYAVADMLRCGFLILPGGHRVGVCGTGVYKDGSIRTLRDISSLNFRIARQINGVATESAREIWKQQQSTLLIGPPCSGKTTMLRDLIRQLSDRFCQRIAVIDERMELAACVNGEMQFHLGNRTDILSGTQKAEGIELVLRSMSPFWIALDEITAYKDVEAMISASYSGVKFLATAHAEESQDLYSRPIYRRLMEEGVFRTIILLDQRKKATLQVLSA